MSKEVIKIVAKQYIKVGLIADYINLMRELADKTQKFDDGCIEYSIFQDNSNANIITLIEEWSDQNSLKKHMDSKHFKAIVPKLDAFYEKRGEVNFYHSVDKS